VDDLNALDCKVFVEANVTIDDLCGFVGRAVRATIDTTGCTKTIRVPIGQMEIRANEDRQQARAADFPDGFLFFRYVLEFYPQACADRADRIKLIADVLNLFWQHGWPAVAAADYEDDLPHKGGYLNPALPWPSANGASGTDGALNSLPQPETIRP
jgi:hypothetical protein